MAIPNSTEEHPLNPLSPKEVTRFPKITGPKHPLRTIPNLFPLFLPTLAHPDCCQRSSRRGSEQLSGGRLIPTNQSPASVQKFLACLEIPQIAPQTLQDQPSPNPI
jgi:hypothetical protein